MSSPTSTTAHPERISRACTRDGSRRMATDDGQRGMPGIPVIPALERFAANPIVRPEQISFTRASGAFNPGAAIERGGGRVALLVRVFEEETRRSCLALALSSDGERIDEIRNRPAVGREAPYEEWG